MRTLVEAKGFDFQDPVLPEDLANQIYRPRQGVPIHWRHRQEAEKQETPVIARFYRGPARPVRRGA